MEEEMYRMRHRQVDMFRNTDSETYYIETDKHVYCKHVYRMYTDIDDYDYVTNKELLVKLNNIFQGR